MENGQKGRISLMDGSLDKPMFTIPEQLYEPRRTEKSSIGESAVMAFELHELTAGDVFADTTEQTSEDSYVLSYPELIEADSKNPYEQNGFGD